jgi:clusterin-associated protein 1
MDEYEKFEQDLVKQYTVYLERFRNLDYLEAELDSLNQAEKEKYLQVSRRDVSRRDASYHTATRLTRSSPQSDRAMKSLQKKLREEELKLLRGDGDAGILGSDENAGSSGGKGLFGQRVERGGGLRDNSNGQGGGGRVKGKMGGGDSEESDSEDLSDEDLTHDTNDSDDVSEGDVSGSSDSSNIIENDSGSDSDDSSDGGGGGGDFQDDEDEDDLF